MTNTITDVGDFTSTLDRSTGNYTVGNGARPQCELVYDRANGLFYGTAPLGGASDSGDVFSFNPVTNDLEDVADLNFASGGGPDDALVYDAANGLFYGTATGGASNQGDVFSFAPANGWTAMGLAVGPDNAAHLLWTGRSGGVALWTLDTTGSLLASAFYGPYAGWAATALSVGPDGGTRLVWDRSDGAASLWDADPSGTVQGSALFGPYY